MTRLAGHRSLHTILLATASAFALSTAISSASAQEAATTEEQPAQEQTAAPKATQLDAVTSTATRTPTAIRDVAGTVSVITAEELERRNAHRMQDIVRYEPGVSVGDNSSRAGSGNFTIRGIGGNRVLVLVDGLPTPDFPVTSTASGSYTRDFVDLESMKRVEIIRGPSSALYGSDGLGGTVAYVTKDPADYLEGLDKDWYASIKGAYDSADESFSEALTGVKRAGNVEMLGIYTRRDGHEVEPNSSAVYNTQDYSSNSFLGKLVFNGLWGNSLKFTGQFDQDETDTDLLTDVGGAVPSTSPFFFSTVTGSWGTDDTRRTLLSAAYSHNTPFLVADNLEAKIFYTRIDRTEHTTQTLTDGLTNYYRVTDLEFEQDILGADLQFGLSRDWSGVVHNFTYGGTVDYTKTTRPRFRTETNLTTNTSSSYFPFNNETFPNKNFPDTTTIKAGIYVQDSIELGRLGIVPALRFDYFKLHPEVDQLFLNSTAGAIPVHDQEETEVSPKLGLTYDVTDEYTLFGQYAHGFRAPPYDNANFAYSNPGYGYEILPNPDLKPETSDGFEAGLRGGFADGSSFSLSGFYNQYEDFIDTVLVGFGGGGIMQFQYQNLSEVTIYGAEAKGEYRFLPDWALRGSFAYARGEDDQTGAPIDSVDPMKGVLGIAYEGEVWGSQLVATHGWRDDRNSAPGNFEAPSYTLVDFMAYYEVSDRFTLNAGIFNIFDEEYYNSQDVAGLAAASPIVGRFAQPGRNFGVNATLKF
ncbi:MAG: TonB-dependent receptor [Parvibaculum sp.]|jgi:hemoglobin/transferrin/lactoferrin receptor protein|uniref:TonB-dependent hemoglobin/transferrin/lactoferrin family receptor n=1 Tax=Parvibaculum sp. TaxID=2024848 RepID=UPI000C508F7F|nr:TonB-dependent hemoglobin/transferrin/lactoferrin family receptor [Parvibaculum sp.]MAU62563.1 TonB-dependent receptor [Parvibaculum sp.]HAC58337.1 TonB-dependent hemoglobin/transferrin/lactoferrin family receptor [Rhodobiaceae bacterium]|tara:strand:+ start:459 stop:2717 length:2259 start_codon:yes stop_codon:yes gene_type:complete